MLISEWIWILKKDLKTQILTTKNKDDEGLVSYKR